MKEKIYTIPVNDAFAESSICPICSLKNQLNSQLVAYYLGASLMEPDVRKTTNEKGFCGDHLDQLYHSEMNRLGLGLMLHTHLSGLSDELKVDLRNSLPGRRTGVFQNRKKDFRQVLKQAAKKLQARTDTCVICDRISQTMNRYLEVIFHEYFANPVFRGHFDQVKTFCLPHTAWMLNGAADHLNQDQVAVMMGALVETQISSLEKLTQDVEWFTLKFDYRNHDKDWKDSKDAIPRSITRLKGSTSGKGSD